MFLKQIVLTCAAVASMTLNALAVTPKTDAKDAKNASATETKTEGKTKLANTYYVTGMTPGGQYTLSQTPPPTGTCGDLGSLPCQISSDDVLSSPIDKEDVDNNPDVTIEAHRQSF